MAKKRIDIELGFSANTNQAKNALKQLQSQLDQISMGKGFELDQGFTKEIQNGIEAASRLNAVLKSATNVQTGKLDLGKFQQSLKQSGMSLTSLRENLQDLGPAGDQAFLNLAKSINMAEVPVLRINDALRKMGQTLANTMRWQISSSILQGFQGALQNALGFAEDLNESLNDIRIVTGYSAEEMDKFAIKANKAAKALSTTTTEYTKASLIYFQQGLSNAEVEKRTQTTIKLANVTGENAQTVSEWMTAVWNNFDNGSKSLEYYADVMTALGAVTASSSEEIAQGLEKFAAIADTIGLSYEYAASALATVTAQTRQSADVVGTAFRTIFARMEGLTLGEQLEDGTDLNKYSQALKTVGVDIVNTSGELKDMDTILNDLGARWQFLSQSQKVALAQTVGGMRQYNQLIALMDNWDTFQTNLSTSLGASGTLEEQASIYAESWEAARDRVTAAAETIYAELLDDDAFIKLLDFFADFLEFLDKTIDSIGGLRGVLLLLGSVITSVFSEQMAAGLSNTGLFLKSLTKAGRQTIEDQKQQVWDEARKMPLGAGGSRDPVINAQAGAFEREMEIEELLYQSMKGRSQLEQDIYRQKANLVKLQQQEWVEAEKAKKEAEERLKIEQDLLETAQKEQKRLEKQKIQIESDPSSKTHAKDLNKVNSELAQANKKVEISTERVANAYTDFEAATERVNRATKDATTTHQTFKQSMDELPPVTYKASEIIVGAANAAMQFGFAISSLSSIGDILKDEDLSPWQKFTSILMTISSIIPVIVKAYQLFNDTTLKNTVYKIANAIATKTQAGAEKELSENKKEVSEEESKENIKNAGSNIIKIVKKWNKETGGLKGAIDRYAWNKQNPGKIAKLTGRIDPDTGRQIVGGFNAKTGKGGAAIAESTLSQAGTKFLTSSITKFGLLAAAIAATVATVALLVRAYNIHNIKANEATKYAEAQKNAFLEAKEANEKLKTSLSSYQQGVEGLKELTRGTLEYKNAVLSANEEALALINSNKELSGKWTVNSDGLIEIDQQSLENLESSSLDKTLKAKNSSIMAEQEAAQLRQNASEINYLREVRSRSDFGEGLGQHLGYGLTGTAGGLAIGATIGSFIPIPIIGTIVGGIIGGLAGTITAAVAGESSNKEEQALATLQKEYQRLQKTGSGDSLFVEGEMERVLQEAGYSKNLIKALTENSSQLEDLIKSNHALEETNKAQNLLLIGNANANNSNYTNSSYKQELDAFVAARLNEDSATYKETFDKKEEELRSFWSTDKGLFEEYIKTVRGAKYNIEEEGSLRVKSAIGGSGKIQIYKDGKWQDEGQLSKDAAIAALTKQELATLTDEDIESYEIKAANYHQVLKEAGLDKDADAEARINIIKQLASGESIKDLSDLSLNNFNAVRKILESEGLSEEEIEKLMADAISHRERGIRDIQDSLNRRENLTLSNTIQDLNKLSENQIRTIAQAIGSIEDTLGQDGLEFIQSILKKEQNSPERQAAIAEVINNFQDWESPYVTELLQKALEEAGVLGVNLAGKEWANLITQMNNSAIAANNSAAAIDDLYTSLTAIKDIIKDLSLGDIISKKDYDTLIKANPEVEKYFYKVAGGYQLINDKLKDGTLLNKEYYDSLLTRAKNADKVVIAANNFEKTNDDIWNLETHSFENKTELSDYNNYRSLINDLPEEILTAIGVDKGSALLKTEEERKDIVNKIEQLFQAIAKGDYASESLLATYINENVFSLEALKEATQDFGVTGNKVYRDYLPLIKQRIALLRKERSEQRLLNIEINRYSQAIDIVGAEADRAYGANKIRLLNQQSDLYEDLIEKNKRLVEIKKEELEELRRINAEYAKHLKFNELGEIIDIDYSWIPEGEDAKATLDAFNAFIDQYQAVIDEIYSATEAAAQAARDAFDAKLEGLQYTIECKVEIQDYQLDELERLFEKLEDKSFSTAEQIANLSEQAGLLNKKMEAYAGMQGKIFDQFGVNSWDELMSMEGVDQQAIMDLLGTTLEELKEIRDTLYDMDKQIADKLVEAFQEWGEEFDKLNAKAERFNSIINSYQNIVNLTRQFTDMDSEIVKNLANASVEVAKTEMEILKNKWETLRDEKKKIDDALALTDTQLEDLYRTNDPMGTRDYWQARLEEINEMIEQAQVEYLGSWENALQVAADAYQTIMGEIFRDFEKQMTGSFGSFEAMEKYYDQQSKLQELWLKDYEKIYELTKLNRKLSQDIDETDNIKAKKELRKLQEEINRLQESDTKLSKYDLEYLQKRYDLKLAEIALEEAQRAKGNVQLSRNASGGWGYVYTADEDKIADAEQKLEDVIFDIQKFGNETILQLGQQITQLKGEWAQALEEIYSSGLTGEELEKALETTNEYYKTTIEDLSTQFDKALAANSSLFDTTFQSDAANLLAQGQGFVTAFDDTIVAGLGDGKTSGSYKTMTDNTKAFIDAIGTAGAEADSPGTGLLGELQSNYNQFRTTADAILNLAGTDFKDLGTDINKHIGTPGSGEDNPGTGILGDLEKLKAAYADLKEKIETENGLIIENLTKWKLDSALIYSAVVAEIEKVEAAAKLAKEAIDALANAEAGADIDGGGPIIPPGDEDKEENEKTSTGENDWRIGGVYAFGSMLNTGKFNNMYEVQDWFNEQSETNGYYFNEAERNALMKQAEERGLKWEYPTSSGVIGGALGLLVTPEIKNKPNISNSSVGQNSSALGFKEGRLDEEFGTFSIGDSVTTGAYGVVTYDILIDPKTGERIANTGRYHTAHAHGEITDKDFINGEWYYLVDGDWVPGKNLSSMGTGGYTGAWGPEGRLAILHEKEIVLNKEDTANFLSALGILDSIVSMIDLQAASRAADASLLKMHGFISGAQSLEQQVTIHAEFPNATDHNEIEEAFNNLINKASQYANRKQ